MNVEAVGQQVEDLLDQIAERDGVAAELSEELVAALMTLYGAGLERVIERLTAAAPAAAHDLTADPLVGGLMMLHGLHPDDVSTRVEAALESVRPYLASHGGGVQLLGVADGVAHLRLEGSCDGCGSSQVTLQHAVEGAVLDAAPEVASIAVDGETAATGTGLIPAESLSLRRREPEWETLVTSVDDLGAGVTARHVNGSTVAVLRTDRGVLAYRDACPSCGGSLDGATMHSDLLDCPGCGRSYDVRNAGRAADDGPGLDPVPLLTDTGAVRVAVGALR